MNIDELDQEHIDLLIKMALKKGTVLQASCPRHHESYADVGEKLDKINANMDTLLRAGLITQLYGDDVDQGIESARTIFKGFNFRVFSITHNGMLLYEKISKPKEDDDGLTIKEWTN